jgi:sec-independent protein translocase protein TatB
MFGMGFTEILLIGIIAIIALGPEKLPSAMVDVAKFFKKLKSGVEDAKSTLNDELNITEIKNQADQFKAQVDGAKANLSLDYLDSIKDDVLGDDFVQNEKALEQKDEKIDLAQELTNHNKVVKREKVSFEKKKKKKKKKEKNLESKEA